MSRVTLTPNSLTGRGKPTDAERGEPAGVLAGPLAAVSAAAFRRGAHTRQKTNILLSVSLSLCRSLSLSQLPSLSKRCLLEPRPDGFVLQRKLIRAAVCQQNLLSTSLCEYEPLERRRNGARCLEAGPPRDRSETALGGQSSARLRTIMEHYSRII